MSEFIKRVLKPFLLFFLPCSQAALQSPCRANQMRMREGELPLHPQKPSPPDFNADSAEKQRKGKQQKLAVLHK